MKVTIRTLMGALSTQKNGQLGALHRLSGHINLRVMAKFRLAHVLDAALQEAEKYTTMRGQLVTTLARRDPATDEVMSDREGNAVFENRNSREAFENEHKTMLDATVTIPGDKFTADELRWFDPHQAVPLDVKKSVITDLSAADLRVLLWLIDEKCFEELGGEAADESTPADEDPKAKKKAAAA